MDEARLIARLGALQAPASDASRERAVRMVSARIRAAGQGEGESSSTDTARAWPPSRGRRRPFLIGLGAACLVAAIVLVVSLPGGGPDRPTRAYGAELVRFAESTPLLLIEGGGWGVRDLNQVGGDQGKIEFTKPSPDPHPDEPLMTRSDVKRGITPDSVKRRRQRRIELVWEDGRQHKLFWQDGRVGTSFYDTNLHRRVRLYQPGRSFKTTIPALGITAYVDPRAETAPIQGGPGDRVMVAVWEEDGRLLELRASVPNLHAFRERLDRLNRVGAEEWLDAMPPRVVKAADYGATVHRMLQGIPLPPGFDPTRISDLHLTNDRYQVGAAVGGTVACEWFRHWGDAIRRGDTTVAKEAELVLQGAGSWPIFREMSKEGAYPATVVEYAEAMPSDRWYGRPLLPEVDQGLGCPAKGFPLEPSGGAK